MKVILNTIDRIKEFVRLAQECPEDIDICSGRYIIDAKSIMGLFSLDLSKPIEVSFHASGEDLARLKEKFAKFSV